MVCIEATFYTAVWRWLACFCAIFSAGTGMAAGGSARPALNDTIWEARLDGFSVEAYRAAVKRLFADWEAAGGAPLRPGEKGKVGLKVFTEMGPGLSTPLNLVEAVVDELRARGFQDRDIILVDLFGQTMGQCGYWPGANSRRSWRFGEVTVIALDRGEHWDRNWVYDNPLPSRDLPVVASTHNLDYMAAEDGDGRLSPLPKPLMFDVDFWINLPVAYDHPALGMMGALANGTIWAVGNQSRFLFSPANAPVAVAEIAAVPEYKATWRLNILSLETYQFIGAPQFNAHYTRSEPLVWMSSNAVALDYAMLHRLNAWRRQEGMPLIEPEPVVFEYCQAIGLGRYGADFIRLVRDASFYATPPSTAHRGDEVEHSPPGNLMRR